MWFRVFSFRVRIALIIIIIFLVFWKGDDVWRSLQDSGNTHIQKLVGWFESQADDWRDMENTTTNNESMAGNNTETTTTTTTLESTTTTTLTDSTTSIGDQITACGSVDLSLDGSKPEWCSQGYCPDGEACMYFEGFGSVDPYCGCVA